MTAPRLQAISVGEGSLSILTAFQTVPNRGIDCVAADLIPAPKPERLVMRGLAVVQRAWLRDTRRLLIRRRVDYRFSRVHGWGTILPLGRGLALVGRI